MNFKHWAFLLVMVICLPAAGAQLERQMGFLPSINLNKKMKDGWALNMKLESRYQTGAFAGGIEDLEEPQYLLTDLSLLVSKKMGLLHTFSGGYLVRIREGELVHRSILQYARVGRLGNLRAAHRLVADQTYAEAEEVLLRFRYRLSLEVPLAGEEVDRNELYIKLNHEYLNAFQDREYDLEVRIVPAAGFLFSDLNKMEIGADYRLSRFLAGPPRHVLWFTASWFLTF